jgi:signal transduction histidine kinase
VRLVGAENPMPAHGDALHVRTIIENLLRNAILYSDQPAEVQVRIGKNRDQVEVDIEDHGRGIPQVEQTALFQRFARVEDGAALPIGGAGLGLFIARWLARAIGGELELVRSEPGKGSLFQLRLPSSPTPAFKAGSVRSRKAAVKTEA